MLVLVSFTSAGHTQVSDRRFAVSGELGGGALPTKHQGDTSADAKRHTEVDYTLGGYGALQADYELTPTLTFLGRYQLELARSPQETLLSQRVLTGLKAQLNVFAWVPWLSVVGGVKVNERESACTWGVGLGLESRRSETTALEIALYYVSPQAWLIGVGARWRLLFDDPFAE